MKEKMFITKKDIVIPAGTKMVNVDGSKKQYIIDCYVTTIGLTNDTSGELFYIIDQDDPAISEWFEEIP